MRRGHAVVWTISRVSVKAVVVALGLLFAPFAGEAQGKAALPTDTLAQVGSRVITSRDLVRRIELMPFPGRQTPVQAESLKARALRTMVSEKLLAGEAIRLGLEADPRLALMRRELENLLIRDELYRREVVANSVPDPAAVEAGMLRYVVELRLLAYTVSSRSAGEVLAQRLHTASPDSLGRTSPPLYVQVESLTVTLGFPDTTLENAAYGIARSRTSPPFLSRSGAWGVLYLVVREKNAEAASLSPADRRRKVTKILQDRNESRTVEEYWYKILREKNAVADPGTFSILADSLSGLWKANPARYRQKEFYLLTSDLVDILLDRLQARLGDVLVRVSDGDLTLGEVLEMFRYEDYGSRAMEGDSFRIDLNEEIKSLVARELLAREGRRLGLQNAPNVREDLRMWEEYWAAGRVVSSIKDSIALEDDDVLRHLIKNREALGNYEVNLRELLLDGIGDAAAAMQELSGGESLASLAARKTKRAEWKARGGESGYFRVADRPELGFRALAADSGKLIGPEKLPEGYSIFTCLGKRRLPAATVGFDTLQAYVRARLLAEKRSAALRKTIASLARGEKVVINSERLQRVTVTTIPMFTRRNIGFGGRMNPVPLLMRQWDWIQELESTPLLP